MRTPSAGIIRIRSRRRAAAPAKGTGVSIHAVSAGKTRRPCDDANIIHDSAEKSSPIFHLSLIVAIT